jgi:hypothetical protein
VIGGGPRPRPGEISLAHQGILFLDELAEFNAPLNPKVEVSDGDGWACSLVSRDRTRLPQFYSLRPSLCGQPAVDDEPGAGHDGGIVGGEKQRRKRRSTCNGCPC